MKEIIQVKNILLSILTILFFVGCSSTTPKANLKKFSHSTTIYPKITVVMTSESLQYARYRNSVLGALSEARVFKHIDVQNSYNPYTLEIYLNAKNKADYIKQPCLYSSV